MKRISLFVLLIFLAVSSVCFADGFDLGLTGVWIYDDPISLYGGGLHLAGTVYFGRSIVGIGFYGNLSYLTSEYNFDALMVNALIGPVFRVVNSSRFALPIAVGAFIDYGIPLTLDIDQWDDMALGFGPGLNITPQIKLGNRTHFFTRLQLGVDILNDFVYDANLSVGIGFGRWR